MPLLKIDIESKSYTTQHGFLEVMRNIHLEIAQGEFLCVVGPSGCGKTSLLNLIAGLDLDYTGAILHGGKAIRSCEPGRHMIFQELGLFPWLTVQENVEFGLKAKGISAPERRRTALKFLEMVHLVQFRRCFLHELSGGMKQRVALARALAMDPEVLLMDEPFGALDAQTRDRLHGELQKIWSVTHKTIVFVTHNVREAVCLGDRVAVLSNRPASVKAIFPIDLERPRQIESYGLVDKAKLVLKELKYEIEKHYEEELHTVPNP